jgi:hypothetical protein
MNIQNEILETITPTLSRLQNALSIEREQAAKLRQDAEDALAIRTRERDALSRELSLLKSAGATDEARAAEALLALASMDNSFRLPPIAEDYLRARNYRRLPAGWVKAGQGGPLPTLLCLREAVAEDLKPLIAPIQKRLSDAARSQIEKLRAEAAARFPATPAAAGASV